MPRSGMGVCCICGVNRNTTKNVKVFNLRLRNHYNFEAWAKIFKCPVAKLKCGSICNRHFAADQYNTRWLIAEAMPFEDQTLILSQFRNHIHKIGTVSEVEDANISTVSLSGQSDLHELIIELGEDEDHLEGEDAVSVSLTEHNVQHELVIEVGPNDEKDGDHLEAEDEIVQRDLGFEIVGPSEETDGDHSVEGDANAVSVSLSEQNAHHDLVIEIGGPSEKEVDAHVEGENADAVSVPLNEQNPHGELVFQIGGPSEVRNVDHSQKGDANAVSDSLNEQNDYRYFSWGKEIKLKNYFEKFSG